MMKIMIMLSWLILWMKHPISIGTMLVMQTIMVSLTIGMLSMNFWFSYILLLILIGGMLIIFMYMTSIASNEKFKFTSTPILVFSLMLFITPNLNFSINSSLTNNITIKNMLNKFFNLPSSLIITLLIIYLLITMIAVIKICKINKGPLRQSF
uniref:NADH-ubiquinone oxidoreductase chain 6 n=1 Tax=Cucujoidea sp. 24 KM-2017 TaxID=2219361 RepID=A0A346RHW1_9CUCU|nr:NADH dehydrogenase subunit 6 [Cucujoidea sp. 24 KM-2017]